MNENSNDGSFEFNNGESRQASTYEDMSGGGFGDDKLSSMSSEPPKGKGGKSVKIAILVAAIILVVAAVFLVAKSGLFSGNKGKVGKAIENTFESGRLFKNFDNLPTLIGDEFTATMDFVSDEVSADIVIKNTAKKQAVNINMDMGIMQLGTDVLVEGSEVNMDLPFLNTLFVYDYKKENSDYLEKILDEAGIDIDEMLEDAADSNNGKIDRELEKVIKKEGKNIKFVEVEKKDFVVNGETVACDGYSATIKNESIKNISEAWDKAYQNELGMNEYQDEITDPNSALEDITSDVIVDFYIYKEYIAAIVINVEDDDEYTIELRGGEYPTQNMMFSSSKEGLLFEIKGETTGSKEITELIVDNETILKLDYDNDLGDFELVIYDGYSDMIVKGSIESSEKDLTFAINEVIYDDESVFYAKFVIRQGATIEELNSTSDKLDLNKLEESDVEALTDKFIEFIMGSY